MPLQVLVKGGLNYQARYLTLLVSEIFNRLGQPTAMSSLRSDARRLLVTSLMSLPCRDLVSNYNLLFNTVGFISPTSQYMKSERHTFNDIKNSQHDDIFIATRSTTTP